MRGQAVTQDGSAFHLVESTCRNMAIFPEKGSQSLHKEFLSGPHQDSSLSSRHVREQEERLSRETSFPCNPPGCLLQIVWEDRLVLEDGESQVLHFLTCDGSGSNLNARLIYQMYWGWGCQ